MRNRKLNWKLLAWLVGTALVSATAVHFAHSQQMKRHAVTLLVDADRADADGKYYQATEYLKRYLTFNTRDTDALARYGFTLDKISSSEVDRSRVIAVFEKVLARDRKRETVRLRLIELYLDLGWPADARRHAEILVQMRAKDAAVFVLLGRCYEAEGESTKARTSYERAVQLEPGRIEASVRLAYLLRRLSFADSADAVMETMVRVNQKEANAYLERARYRIGNRSLKGAEEDLAEARKLAPKDARILLASADLAQWLGAAEEARKWWQLGVEQHAADAVLHAGLAALELQQSHPEAALPILRAALKRYPNDPELIYLQFEASLQLGNLKDAEAVIDALRARGGQTSLANYCAARLLLNQHRPLEAAQALEETLRQSTLSPRLAAHICLCMGQAYEQIGNGDRQLAAYSKAVELSPELVRVRVQLGATLLARGAIDAAVEQLSEATRLPLPPAEVWTLLARALIQHTLALPLNSRNWNKVQAALDKAEANASQAVAVALLRADVLQARGLPADALLAKACIDHPKQPELWAVRARLAMRAGQFKRSAEILDEARGKLGDAVELRLAALECWSGAEGAQALDFLRAQETGLDRFAAPARAHLEAALAAIYFRLHNSAEGERLCRRMLEDSRAGDFSDWVRLLDLVLQGTDDALIDEVVQGLKNRESEAGAWWRYAEAAHLVSKAARGDRTGLTEARAALEKVTRLRPGWGRAALLQAFLDDVHGDATGALDGYRRAFDLGERQLAVVQRLVVLLAERGRFTEADEVLRKAQEQLIPRGEFARTAAEIALSERNFERAVVLARLAVPEDTTDPVRLLWLGQMYVAAGQSAQAEELFRAVAVRAWDAEKKVWRYDPLDAWLALITHLARDNRPMEADSAIDQMRHHLPPEQQPFALGVCYEALGRMELAEKNYAEALERRKNESLLLQRLASLYIRVNQANKAEPLLLRMLGPTVVAPEANLAWARLQLALLVAERGGEDNVKAAIVLIEANRRNGRETLSDERALAFVQATRPESRSAALKTLENSRPVQPMEPDELFRLARLYEASKDDWSRVRELMDEVLKLDAMNPEYLAHHVTNLLKHGDRNGARPLVERLARLEGDTERVKGFRIEVEKKER